MNYVALAVLAIAGGVFLGRLIAWWITYDCPREDLEVPEPRPRGVIVRNVKCGGDLVVTNHADLDDWREWLSNTELPPEVPFRYWKVTTTAVSLNVWRHRFYLLPDLPTKPPPRFCPRCGDRLGGPTYNENCPVCLERWQRYEAATNAT